MRLKLTLTSTCLPIQDQQSCCSIIGLVLCTKYSELTKLILAFFLEKCLVKQLVSFFNEMKSINLLVNG